MLALICTQPALGGRRARTGPRIDSTPPPTAHALGGGRTRPAGQEAARRPPPGQPQVRASVRSRRLARRPIRAARRRAPKRLPPSRGAHVRRSPICARPAGRARALAAAMGATKDWPPPRAPCATGAGSGAGRPEPSINGRPCGNMWHRRRRVSSGPVAWAPPPPGAPPKRSAFEFLGPWPRAPDAAGRQFIGGRPV